jgi:hypothetical protein
VKLVENKLKPVENLWRDCGKKGASLGKRCGITREK